MSADVSADVGAAAAAPANANANGGVAPPRDSDVTMGDGGDVTMERTNSVDVEKGAALSAPAVPAGKG